MQRLVVRPRSTTSPTVVAFVDNNKYDELATGDGACTRFADRCSKNRMTSWRFQQTLFVGVRTKRDGNCPAFSRASMVDIDSGTSASRSRRLRYSRATAGRA